MNQTDPSSVQCSLWDGSSAYNSCIGCHEFAKEVNDVERTSRCCERDGKVHHLEKARWEEEKSFFHMIPGLKNTKLCLLLGEACYNTCMRIFFSFTLSANIDLHFSEGMTLEDVCH